MHELFTLLLFACGESDICEKPFNQSFEVNQGESYCLEDGSRLTISEITSSYCSCDAICTWQGETAVIAERITGDQVEVVIFHEELLDENPRWGHISLIKVSEECTPQPTQVSVIITN